MGKYSRSDARRRRRNSLLPLFFFLMIITALLLIGSRLRLALPKELLVIRDTASSGSYYPAQTDGETDRAEGPYDSVIVSPLFPEENVSHRTSFHLDVETGNNPAETLPSLQTTPVTLPDPPKSQLERIPEDYDYSSPVPASDPVGREYLQDAVLIGDSRMQGLILYCGLSKTTSYTYKGLTVDSVFTRPVIEWEQDETTPEKDRVPDELYEDGKIPVMEALKRTECSKVFIMLGINETGWPDAAYFKEAYGTVIDAVREAHPDCLVYVLSVFPVTRTVSETHDYVTNEKIALFNRYLQEMTEEKKVFLVDLSPAVVNEDGVLPEDSGVDGIHLNKTYCTMVLDHILSHTVPLTEE